MSESLFLSANELKLLFVLKHMGRLYCFDRLGERDLLEKEAIEAMFSLSKKDLVTFRSEKELHLNEELSGMLETIRVAEKVIYATHFGEVHSSICIYSDNKCVRKAVWLEGLDETGTLFRIGETIDALHILEEKGYLLDEVVSDDLLYRKEEVDHDVNLKESSKIEVIDEKQVRHLCSIILGKSTDGDFINFEKNTTKKGYWYSKRKLFEIITGEE